METPTQTARVLAAQAGDQMAFETLVGAYRRELLSHAGLGPRRRRPRARDPAARMGETRDPHEPGIVPGLVVPHRHQSVPEYAHPRSSTVLATRHPSPERSQQPCAATAAGADLAG